MSTGDALTSSGSEPALIGDFLPAPGRADRTPCTPRQSDSRHVPISRSLDLAIMTSPRGLMALLDRVFQLRDNFSCYDAVCVALAEALDATLGSGDERLIGAAQAHTEVRLEGWSRDLERHAVNRFG